MIIQALVNEIVYNYLMEIIHRVQSEDALKMLGDATRLGILRILISKHATISQLGVIFNIHPAQIRNHVKQLEKQGLVELASVQVSKNYTEKYYRATASMFLLNMAVLPESFDKDQLIILASDDPALDLLVKITNEKMNNQFVYNLPVGSLDGLIYLREKYSHIAGCHLFDIDSGEYNIPYIRHLFSDQTMVLVTLAYRQQGLILRKGNPKEITGLNDLQREDVTFINRKRGSGTRLWVDQHLKAIGIMPETLRYYHKDASTHAIVAEAVLRGAATTGIGILSIARQYDLDFIPLFKERYDLVMMIETFSSSNFQPMMDILRSRDYQKKVTQLGGYDTNHMGEMLQI